ncbi:hypothetical protein [Acinetobacter ursingii]|uniref:hypothetical protein n=1 Tax=Acinetobacter ursingii TaxID=108980 RepID=UPI00124F9C7B|nr:hypothetical protein [Acinetobacter ursingii]
MDRNSAQKELQSFLKDSTDEDLIWILHFMNKDNIQYRDRCDIHYLNDDLIRSTIDILNTLKSAEEIRKILSENYISVYQNDIFNFLNELNIYRQSLTIRGKDISNYKSNKRLLYFALKCMSSDRNLSWRQISEIKNEYFRFIFILLISPLYSQSTRHLDYIEQKFSRILNKYELHFKNCDNNDFYLWAKGYIDKDDANSRVYDSRSYNPVNPQDYKIVINAIFDNLLNLDPNIYKALKDQISNAWYQKRYRKKIKGREHYYRFTDKSYKCLEILADKNNLTKEKMIEQLINERYAKECVNINGNHLYLK